MNISDRFKIDWLWSIIASGVLIRLIFAGILNMLPEVAGENLIGDNNLMWNSWVLPQLAVGRVAMLVSFTEDRLKQPSVTRHFLEVSEITEEVLTNRSGEIGHFYWRAGYGFGPERLAPMRGRTPN